MHDHHPDSHRSSHRTLQSRIEQDRVAKDAFFRGSPESPLPAPAQLGFAGLSYFPVDPAYRLEGVRLVPYDEQGSASFQLPTSDGRWRPAGRVGALHFRLFGRPHALNGYDLSGGRGHGLFVPFLDATSGTTTYGAGRYLDLAPEADGSYVLDFNLAYQPYCAYSAAYSCPLTPQENRLAVRIEAGERLPGADMAG